MKNPIQNPSGQILKVFVAMPGTTMGSSAKWNTPDEIKDHFFQPISQKLKDSLQIPIDFVVEKHRKLSGDIHRTMFDEAKNADVYIADLTGNNPNVYLELGVRWTSKDNVTIIVSQDVSDIKFNVNSNRVFSYAQNPEALNQAINDVFETIMKGLADLNYCDSPVRLGSPTILVSRDEYQSLNKQIDELKEERGQDFLAAGKMAEIPSERIQLFKEALKRNPNYVEAYIELAIEMRKQSRYEEAIETLQKASKLKPDSSLIYRELGLNYGKCGDQEGSVNALEKAVEINPSDTETWSNLGGALRRLATKDSLGKINSTVLQRARDSYNEAYKIDQYSNYALGNMARIDFMLSAFDPRIKALALKELDSLRLLCNYLLDRNPNDYWILFDLADTYLFQGDLEESLSKYRVAIGMISKGTKKSILTSVKSVLEDVLHLEMIDEKTTYAFDKIMVEIENAIKADIM